MKNPRKNVRNWVKKRRKKNAMKNVKKKREKTKKKMKMSLKTPIMKTNFLTTDLKKHRILYKIADLGTTHSITLKLNGSIELV